MKVGTDALMLGSWAQLNDAKTVLDIGTGSGILAIMAAQNSSLNSQIIGIDIDAGAVQQASENMARSPWSSRLHCIQVSLSQYHPEHKFEAIVSNPPFFAAKQGDLSAADPNFLQPARRIARHTQTLDLNLLMQRVSELLTSKGQFFCILPFQTEDVEGTAGKYGLYSSKQLTVYSKPNKPAIRQLYCFTNRKTNTLEDAITIYDDENAYTEDYRRLCQGFYLNF